MKNLFSTLGVTLLSFVFTIGFAYHQPGDFYLTPSIGYLKFDGGQSVKAAAFPSIGIGYQVNNHFAIQTTLGGTLSNRSDVGGKVRIASALFDGVLRFNTPNKFEPYAFAGVGLFYMKPNGFINPNNPNGDLSFTQTVINGGLGLDIFLDKRLALNYTVQDMYRPTRSRNQWMATMGVTILFPGINLPNPLNAFK